MTTGRLEPGSGDAIAAIREFVEQAARGDVDLRLIKFLAGRWRAYLDNAADGMSEGQAFGYASDWWATEQRAKYAAAVKSLADEHFSEFAPRERSIRIEQRLQRYLRGRWKRDQRIGMPSIYEGTVDEHLFRIAQLAGGAEKSARTIQRTLSRSQAVER